jgi:hypothetical protein
MLGVKFQVNHSSEMTYDTGQNKLYDMWTSYLTMILFLQECQSLF